MGFEALVRCDSPRCNVTATPEPFPFKNSAPGPPDTWLIIEVTRARDGVKAARGGTGELMFHSARCLLDWATQCARIDPDAPFHDPEVIGAAARYINEHVPAPRTGPDSMPDGRWGPQESNEIATYIMRAVAEREQGESR